MTLFNKKEEKYVSLIFLITGLSFVIIFVCALLFGRYNISLNAFFNTLFNGENNDLERSIILNLRLPRTILAALTGIALSVSGLLYQETFQNKLVSPDLLGVSSGSAVGAAFAILLGMSSVFISLFAFVFGIITVAITMFVARCFQNKSSLILTLSGIIVSGCMTSILSFIKYLADAETTLASITFWLMGSFENSIINDVYVLFPIVLISSLILILISWRINIVSLGFEEAQTKGINYKAYRTLIILIATLLTAASVAFVGTISWVGLVVPNIVRLMLGRDTKKTIPMSMLFGATFMVFVDILSRVFTASEIPVSAVTGLLGTIIFVIILIVRRKTLHENY